MVYVRIRDSGLPQEQIAAVSKAFEEVCRLLSLSPREEPYEVLWLKLWCIARNKE